MSNLAFKCSCCGNQIEVTAEQIGYVVYCTNCMAELIVPDLSSQVQVPASRPKDLSRSKVAPEKLSPFADPTPSQIIYRDADGNPLIPSNTEKTPAGPGKEELSETKIELANTLKELQEQQRALAEARKELAEKRKLLAETNHAFMSETTNSLMDSRRTERLETGGHQDLLQSQGLPFVGENLPELGQDLSQGVSQPAKSFEECDTAKLPMGGQSPSFEECDTSQLPMNEPPPTFEEADTQQAMLMDAPSPPAIPVGQHHNMRYNPLFTPYGDFLPFSEDDISLALHGEDPGIFEYLQDIYPTPNCWSYTLFGIILEFHVATHMPESVRFEPMPTVFFGSTDKHLQAMVQHQAVLLNILRRLLKPLGEQLQHAIIHHDIHAFTATARELDQPMVDLTAFVDRFQKESFPKKSPFPEIHDLILGFYHDVRERLLRISDRLNERSGMTPAEADKSTVSVSIMPPGIHRLNLMLRTIPTV